MSLTKNVMSCNIKLDVRSALGVEKTYNNALMITFPEPTFNSNTVKKFYPGIKDVKFIEPFVSHRCIVMLEDDVDIDVIKLGLEQMKFGSSFLSVSYLSSENETNEKTRIDPQTLFVQNLPVTATENDIFTLFPSCTKAKDGPLTTDKKTKAVLVRFSNIENAITAFRKTQHSCYKKHILNVQFHRKNLRFNPYAFSKDICNGTTDTSEQQFARSIYYGKDMQNLKVTKLLQNNVESNQKVIKRLENEPSKLIPVIYNSYSNSLKPNSHCCQNFQIKNSNKYSSSLKITNDNNSKYIKYKLASSKSVLRTVTNRSRNDKLINEDEVEDELSEYEDYSNDVFQHHLETLDINMHAVNN